MSLRKKLGYNWKARQRKVCSNGRSGEVALPKVEGLSESATYCGSEGHGLVGDSNALVLPSKRKKTDQSDGEPAPKRKKLSSKQKKRLMKVLEAKEKKAQVCF